MQEGGGQPGPRQVERRTCQRLETGLAGAPGGARVAGGRDVGVTGGGPQPCKGARWGDSDRPHPAAELDFLLPLVLILSHYVWLCRFYDQESGNFS